MCNHNKIIAKIQHFSDMMNSYIEQKEAIAFICEDSDVKNFLRNEISLYTRIANDYDDVFKEILSKD
jgi:hypothetical protein